MAARFKTRKDDAIVLAHVARDGRLAPGLKISRARANDVADGSGLAGHHRRVWKSSDADPHVDAFIDEIDYAVGKHHFHRDAGIAPQIVQHHREDMQPPEDDRSRERQLAAWLVILACKPGLCASSSLKRLRQVSR